MCARASVCVCVCVCKYLGIYIYIYMCVQGCASMIKCRRLKTRKNWADPAARIVCVCESERERERGPDYACAGVHSMRKR